MGIKAFFSKIKSVLAKAFQMVKDSGLTDELILIALPFVRVASTKYVDNAERREWVVAALMARKVPEGIARIAVELAYKLYKKELEKIGI